MLSKPTWLFGYMVLAGMAAILADARGREKDTSDECAEGFHYSKKQE